MPAVVAILIVNGFDRRDRWGPHSADEARRYPWLDLCLRQIARHTRTMDWEVLVHDNARLPEHRRLVARHGRVRVFVDPHGRELSHPSALDALVARTGDAVEYIVTLDTDAFPVRDGWLEELTGRLDSGAAIAGIYRDEMTARLRPFVHPSCLCIRRETLLGLDVSFGRRMTQDVGQNITEALVRRGDRTAGLRRSNARDFHFLLGGLYGDLVYHHGAGSRHAKFFTSTDVEHDERVRVVLRDAAFADLDHLVSVLRGEVDDDLGLVERADPEAVEEPVVVEAGERVDERAPVADVTGEDVR